MLRTMTVYRRAWGHAPPENLHVLRLNLETSWHMITTELTSGKLFEFTSRFLTPANKQY